MKIVQQARCERPNMEFQILYLRTAGRAISSYSYGLALWYLITLYTFSRYMTVVAHDVMKSMKSTVSKTRLIFAKPPGKSLRSSGRTDSGIGLLLSQTTTHVFVVSTANRM